MICCITLNPIIIAIYLLNVFVTLTGSTYIGNIKFEDDDNFGVKSLNSPANSDADYSELFHTDESNSSSKPPDTEKLKIPSKIEEMEAVFVAMYENYTENKKWELMDNGDHKVLCKICATVWDDSSNLTCEAERKPFHNNRGDSLRVVVTEKKNDRRIEKKIRTDFLKCKCWPSDFQAYIGRKDAVPICLAKYDQSHVFVLKAPRGIRKMKICEIKHINYSSWTFSPVISTTSTILNS